MPFIETIAYPCGLLMTMLVFMRSYEPKKLPAARLAPFLAFALIVNYCPFGLFPTLNNQFFIFLLLLTVDAVMALGMGFTFHIRPMQLLSACTSGVALQHLSFHLMNLLLICPGIRHSVWLEMATVAAVSLLTVLLFGKRLEKHIHPARRDHRLTFISFAIVLICIGITRFTRVDWDYNASVRAALSLYAITCCLLALLMQYFLYNLSEAEAEKNILRHMQAEAERHYSISRDTSEQLHIIYHDLKHKLTAFRQMLPEEELHAMQQTLDTFSDICHTGLESLDVVLDEKYRYARGHQVTITFMGNGRDFSFMNPLDVYSLFGNLLDNAVTAAEQLAEKEQKIVSVTAERRGGFLYLVVSNYLPGDAQLSLYDGLPVSTKKQEQGFHGYGLRSVLTTARKYNGDMIISTADHIFMVTVYMLPASA